MQWYLFLHLYYTLYKTNCHLASSSLGGGGGAITKKYQSRQKTGMHPDSRCKAKKGKRSSILNHFRIKMSSFKKVQSNGESTHLSASWRAAFWPAKSSTKIWDTRRTEVRRDLCCLCGGSRSGPRAPCCDLYCACLWKERKNNPALSYESSMFWTQIYDF